MLKRGFLEDLFGQRDEIDYCLLLQIINHRTTAPRGVFYSRERHTDRTNCRLVMRTLNYYIFSVMLGSPLLLNDRVGRRANRFSHFFLPSAYYFSRLSSAAFLLLLSKPNASPNSIRVHKLDIQRGFFKNQDTRGRIAVRRRELLYTGHRRPTGQLGWYTALYHTLPRQRL